MANTINFGKVYCEMFTNNSWGADVQYTTNAVNDIGAPTCWDVFAITADSINFTSDSTVLTADVTQI